jgi:lipoate-protein ligase A
MQWRFLDSGAATGAYNMALDMAILSEVEAGRSPPTVRIYGWNPPCISLGHSQRAEAELDLAAVTARGYDVVKRPTGGRAVLHIDELTYSVIAPFDAAPWCSTQALSYRTISQALARALDKDGVGVALDRGYPVEKPQHLRAMTPCFSSTARSEVVWGDRKVVGSAQRRFRSAFLQHGSILISEKHRGIVECLRLDSARRKEYLAILDQNAVSLERILGRPLHWTRVAVEFLPRLAGALGIVGGTEVPTEAEQALVARTLSHEAFAGATLWSLGAGVVSQGPAVEPQPRGFGPQADGAGDA